MSAVLNKLGKLLEYLQPIPVYSAANRSRDLLAQITSSTEIYCDTYTYIHSDTYRVYHL